MRKLWVGLVILYVIICPVFFTISYSIKWMTIDMIKEISAVIINKQIIGVIFILILFDLFSKDIINSIKKILSGSKSEAESIPPSEQKNDSIERDVMDKGWREIYDKEMLAYTGNDPNVKARIDRILMYQFSDANYKWGLQKDRIVIIISFVALGISLLTLLLK